MTDEQKAALAWLDKCIVLTPGNYVEVTDIVTVARTLKAMLAEPRLPKEPSIELLDAMEAASYAPVSTTMMTLGWDKARQIYSALYAHLTAPVDDLDEIRRYGT